MKEGNYDIMYSGSHDFFFNIYLQLCNQDFLLGFTVNLTEISSILKKKTTKNSLSLYEFVIGGYRDTHLVIICIHKCMF